MLNNAVQYIALLFQYGLFPLISLKGKLRAESVVLLWILASVLTTAHADIQYSYDAAGRLVRVIAADGATATYQYDGNDNMIAIQSPVLAKSPAANPVQTAAKEALNKSFDCSTSSQLRTNGNYLIPFVVSLSNYGRNQINQGFPKSIPPINIETGSNLIAFRTDWVHNRIDALVH